MSKSDAKMSPKELRKFGLVTAGMLILFFDLLIPWIWDVSRPVWPLYPAVILVSMALIIPAALGPVYNVWMRFAEALGWVNTRIILSVIFFVVFFPFGIIMRMFNDPMRRKFDPAVDSYRVSSSPTKPENMERPF
jgi:Saxitoxin biosynthesis operon protein SxtJ